MTRKLLFCTHKVNRANIKRESRKGVEHIILTSFTLPPDSVMNNGFYSTEERDKSFKTLNRTPVTVGHPEIDGSFVSASDPEIDFDFRFGAFNENARITKDNRIALDKVINVQKALKTEIGKRLLDRVEDLETNEKAKPIHTSVGLFLEVEELSSPKTNAAGDEYTWIASDMVFDHDAILLDEVGASTPSQGTGIGINKEKMKVEFFNCFSEKTDSKFEKAVDLRTNKELSFSDIHHKIFQLLNETLESNENWILEVFQDTFIFEDNNGNLFRKGYLVDEQGNLSLQGEQLSVERIVEFKPKNVETEDNTMIRDTIIAELAKMGITVNAEISDADLLARHQEALLAANSGNDADNEDHGTDAGDSTNIAEVVANAVKTAIEPLQTEISDLKANQATADDAEISDLAQQIVNSDQYKGLDADTIKGLGLEKVKSMAANCGIAFGLGSTMQTNHGSDELMTFELPE